MKHRFLVPGIAAALLTSCGKDQLEKYNAAPAFALAGACTVYDQSANAFTYKVNGLNFDEQAQFFTGNSFFNNNWVIAPSSTEARDGLGPLFNARSCSGCHFKDGRGQPFTGLGLLFRLGTPSGAIEGANYDQIYSNQLEDHSILGVAAEGSMNISYVEIAGQYPDGTPYSLRKPIYSITGANYGAVSSTQISPRVAPQMIGLGLLELVPEWRLQELADEYDSDHDGISGRINRVKNAATGTTDVGRFGWKANEPNIAQQAAGAFNGDIGITSLMFPNENYTSFETDCLVQPNGGTPEIDEANFQAVVTYCRTLAVPAQRNHYTEAVSKGAQLFGQIKCIGCHTETHTSSSEGTIAALKNVTFFPFTDLLLHDMGDGLADGLPDFLANGNEWRTQPLWGIGLIKAVNNHTYLLHDGRARSIEEAILWHGGEAEASKKAFMMLNAQDRGYVLKFLESL